MKRLLVAVALLGLASCGDDAQIRRSVADYYRRCPTCDDAPAFVAPDVSGPAWNTPQIPIWNEPPVRSWQPPLQQPSFGVPVAPGYIAPGSCATSAYAPGTCFLP
jgi:hypothetical protein